MPLEIVKLPATFIFPDVEVKVPPDRAKLLTLNVPVAGRDRFPPVLMVNDPLAIEKGLKLLKFIAIAVVRLYPLGKTKPLKPVKLDPEL